jgi:hypothetical protein
VLCIIFYIICRQIFPSVTDSLNNMAWRSTGATNKDLIENLFRNGLITSPLVKNAMEKVALPSPFF